jgi:urease accessory protein
VLWALAAADADAWQDLDAQVEMQTLSDASRAASRRSGQALLGAWARLGHEDVQEYQGRVRGGSALGHQCVVQGLVYASAGLTHEAAELASCWSAMTGVVSAAVRLDLIGHLAGQRLLMRAVPLMADALATPVAPDASPSGWSPLVDIAVARHQLSPSRQFAS